MTFSARMFVYQVTLLAFSVGLIWAGAYVTLFAMALFVPVGFSSSIGILVAYAAVVLLMSAYVLYRSGRHLLQVLRLGPPTRFRGWRYLAGIFSSALFGALLLIIAKYRPPPMLLMSIEAITLYLPVALLAMIALPGPGPANQEPSSGPR